jgi:hypothetical protein
MELQALTNGIQVHNAKLQAAKESKAIRIYDLSPLHSFDQLPVSDNPLYHNIDF